MHSRDLRRYVPFAAWVVVVFALCLAAGKVIGYGFLPADDALRHAAKVVSGKTWSEILVLRDGFQIDPHPGWHAVLGEVRGVAGSDTERLVVFSVAGLMLLFSLSVLPWLRRPEAWLAALLVSAIFSPPFINRLFMGRPYIFTMAAALTLIVVWSRLEQRLPGKVELISTVLLVAAASWIHGSFYQLILPAAALLLAGRWRQTLWYGGCWVAGSILGAALTGHPWLFLGQCVRHLSGVLGDFAVSRQLVPEIMPMDGDPAMVLAVVAMLLWRSRSPDWNARSLVHPIFLMGVLGWLLGLKVGRFWWDWGLPAMLLWMALELQQQLTKHLAADSGRRLILVLGVALGFILAVANDRNSRWTWNLNKQYLTTDNPELTGWMPEKGGIIYSADVTVFFDTFFKNPNADWRYVLGFESALMRPEDLAVMRKLQWNYGDVRAYEPWVMKMRPPDRLVIPISWMPGGGAPNIPGLEWKFALNSFWIGRLPRTVGGAGPGR